MRKKLLLIPALFLIPSCLASEQRIEQAQILYKNRTIDDIKIGDKITVEPKTLVYEGESKTVEGQIILPDGTSVSGKNFTVTMPGIYTVNYRAFFGAHEEIVSIYYHCHRSSGDFFLSSNKDNLAQTGEYSHPINNGEIKGAILKLDNKTTFTYDGEIDFNAFDFSNSFIDFVVDTSKQGTSDIESFTVRLTDTEDTNNYVDIAVTDSGPIDDAGRGCYILAGSNSQFKTGFEGGRNGRLWVSKYGANVGSSFRDLPDKSAKVAKLYFNYSNKELYVSPLINSGVKDIITDLDDKSIYGSTIWEGFTNGTATLSIFANSLLSSSATLIVSKIANIDLSPLDFVDVDAPSIRINYNGQSSINVPMASVNKPYRIYDAIISDNFDRHLSYSAYVTYYDSINGKTRDITIEDGYFTPKEKGQYTITYIAKDRSNNYANKTVDVIAIDDDQAMTIVLDQDTITQDLYSLVQLPTIDEVKTKITGGSGKPTVERTIFDSEGQEITIIGDSFIPNKIGQYKVYYKAKDYINNTAATLLKVNVEDPGHPVFIEEFNLPPILIKGHTYTLPNYLGAEVDNGKTVYLESKVSINGAELANNTFVADDNCSVSYKLNGKTGIEEHNESIQVVDVGYPIYIGSYFYGDFEAEVNKDDITLSAESGNVSSVFASQLSYNNLFLKFAISRDLFNIDELVFKFTDSTNKNNSLSFRFKIKNDNAYISIGGDTTEYLFSSFIEKSNELFAIDFSSSDMSVKDILHNDVSVVRFNDQGELFLGFGGGVYLDISMNNVKTHSSLKMLTISNQALGNVGMVDYYDFIEPIITLKDNFIPEQSYNSEAFIPTAEVFDVFSYADIKLSVMAPDRTYKIRNEDATIKHSFVLNQFGKYIVIYTGTDIEGNYTEYRRGITVYDFVPPELIINGSLSSTYNINSTITIPSYTVRDNLGSYTLDIFLLMPDNQDRLLLIDRSGVVTSYLEKDNMYYNASFKVDSRTFRAEQYGHYILRYVAYDSDYNKVVKELAFDVK